MKEPNPRPGESQRDPASIGLNILLQDIEKGIQQDTWASGFREDVTVTLLITPTHRHTLPKQRNLRSLSGPFAFILEYSFLYLGKEYLTSFRAIYNQLQSEIWLPWSTKPGSIKRFYKLLKISLQFMEVIKLETGSGCVFIITMDNTILIPKFKCLFKRTGCWWW